MHGMLYQAVFCQQFGLLLKKNRLRVKFEDAKIRKKKKRYSKKSARALKYKILMKYFEDFPAKL